MTDEDMIMLMSAAEELRRQGKRELAMAVYEAYGQLLDRPEQAEALARDLNMSAIPPDYKQSIPMSDLFNKKPADPDWVRKLDEVAADATTKLECMVIIIAVQDRGGKCGLAVEGIPPTGELHDMAQDVPQMLNTLSTILTIQKVFKDDDR